MFVVYLVVYLITFVGFLGWFHAIKTRSRSPLRRRPRPAPRRRAVRDAASRARRLTAICTGAATAWMAGGTVAAAAGQPLAAVILYVTAFILAAGATWPALRRRYAWLLANPSLAWCMLAGKAYRRQMRAVLARAAPTGHLPAGDELADDDRALIESGCVGPPLALPSGRRISTEDWARLGGRLPGHWTSPAVPRRTSGSLLESRRQLGLTAGRLDVSAGLSPGTVTDIEAGQRRVTVREARALESALQRATAAKEAVFVDGRWQPARAEAALRMATRGVSGPERYTAHYHAISGGWVHYSEGQSALWFGPPDPGCRCHACQPQ